MAATKTPAITVKLPYFGPTKNMYRYQVDKEAKDTVPVNNVYIKQDAFPENEPPAFLKITVEGADK